MVKFKSIAIDGPAGAGKSTVAKHLANKLNYLYVDTGALYRAIGLYMIKNNISYTDELATAENLKNINLELKYIDNVQHVFLNFDDVTSQIRSSEVSLAASSVSAFKSVRNFLINLQRNIAKNNNVIMDGRDIATVVLPNADIKIFLTASAKIRAIRRYKELSTINPNETFDEVYKDMVTRDSNDSSRDVAPLKQAEDAVLIDSSNMSFDETVDYIHNIVKERLF